MKLCPRCKIRPSRRNITKDSYPYCVECFSDYNRDRHIKRMNLVNQIKSIPCRDCGREYPPYVMDFDHIRDKKFTVSKMGSMSLSKLLEEIEKCEVVCANCHRERTYLRGLA